MAELLAELNLDVDGADRKRLEQRIKDKKEELKILEEALKTTKEQLRMKAESKSEYWRLIAEYEEEEKIKHPRKYNPKFVEQN